MSKWRSKRRDYDLPLIAPEAVDAYLGRELDDFSFLKAVPRAELLTHAHELGFRYVTDPRNCQLVCNIIAAQMPHFLFYLDMGGGKSKAFLDIVRFRKSRGELQRALITPPEYIHIDAWEDQLKEHAPDLSYVVLRGDKEERFKLIDKKVDICLLNHAGLQVYMSEPKRRKKSGKIKKGVDSDAAGLFSSMFNMVLFDEIHRIQSHDSLTFRLCCWLAAGAPFHYGFTGTPHGRDPLRVWPQFKIIDDGETLGILGMFRAAFSTAKKKYFGGYDYKFRDDRLLPFHEVIKHRSIVYQEHELEIDLPETSYIKVPVKLLQEGRLYYDRIIGRMKEAKGDYRSLDNVFMRMQQCASGFLSLKADDESRLEVQVDPNPKVEALRQFFMDLPAGEKVLVFHNFTYSGNKIRALLVEMKIEHVSLYGGIGDTKTPYQRFLKDQKCQVFVLQAKTGSEGINPQYVCRYGYFYETPDCLTWIQAVKRIRRPGQNKRSFIYSSVVVNSIEEKLYAYAREGRDLLKAVLSGEERLT